MSRRGCLTLAALLFSTSLFADDQAIWREYGLVQTQTAQQGKLTVTSYQMKDTTGALAAWEWIRTPGAHSCDLAALCSQDAGRTVVSDFNWVLVFSGGQPDKAQVASALAALPNKHDSALSALLTYLPEKGLVPNSARYVLGPASLAAFAPEIGSMDLGLDRGGEAQIAQYRLGKDAAPVRLALFYYPTPEIARIHSAQLRQRSDLHVKRAGTLVALTLPPADSQLSDTLLSRVHYTAHVTEDDLPPPSPIKPLYLLLRNILYTCVVLSALCVVAGLIYAGMRIYRRRYGTLDSEESMTTLRLTE
ncbi:MAG TPA: DUF6599 family protein [Bryobacteraceae bacterium]|jgi:hypothetical protein|nr:DUF6599 family protein [Bryobacteraceae bacterium]